MTKRSDFFLNIPPNLTPRAQLERCKKELLSIKNDDDGRAHAFLSTVTNESVRQKEDRERREVYAWVRAQGSQNKTVQVVSVFIPCKEFSKLRESRERVSYGYRPLGLIDNYFWDIFGFVHPDRTQDKNRPIRYYQGMISRYTYITQAKAEEMAAIRAQEKVPLYLSKTKKDAIAYMEESIAWLEGHSLIPPRAGGPSFS